ncbi:MAG: hypothetical protein WBD28_01890 [Candidatus Zixiibacteriota bacterium]
MIFRFFFVFILSFSLFSANSFALNEGSEELTDSDYTVLKVCEGVIQLFQQFPDSVWPGYDLAQRPFIVYVPEKWALLFNYSKQTDDFTAYPKDWPDLGTDVLFHKGQYKHLAGQLAFEFPIDTIRVAAINFTDEDEVKFFGYVVHENFHQYQFRAFGEIPWEREQKYPIQDNENTALACLEMHILMDAIKAVYADNRKQAEECVKQFVAVRDIRWKQSDPFVAKYEQGQEINEGTARYIETKSISLMTKLKYNSSLSSLTSPLSEDFSLISMPEYLLKDFEDRMTENSISPEAMPRYRIYPVGSAQGFLLDYFKIDWKNKAQEAGTEFTYAELLKNHLGLEENQFEELLKKTKKNYGYEEILASTDKLIQEYSEGFKGELESFETQPGNRIEIILKSSGVLRSRSSRAKKWLVDKGTKELCSHFNIYTLKDDDLLFQVHDSGLLEENDWDKRIRKVIFFAPEISSISLDGNSIKLAKGKLHQFQNIEVQGTNFQLTYSQKGNINFTDNRIKIHLIP